MNEVSCSHISASHSCYPLTKYMQIQAQFLLETLRNKNSINFFSNKVWNSGFGCCTKMVSSKVSHFYHSVKSVSVIAPSADQYYGERLVKLDWPAKITSPIASSHPATVKPDTPTLSHECFHPKKKIIRFVEWVSLINHIDILEIRTQI